MNLYNLSEIRNKIKKYKLQQILESGENDMFDDKIDRKKLEEAINEIGDAKEKKSEFAEKLKKTVEEIDSQKMFDCIINLKSKKYVE